MEQKKQQLKTPQIISMSNKTKARLKEVAKNIEGKELFPEKVALAKKTFRKIKSLPM